MIGQEKLKEAIDTICKTRGLPRFTIITGQRGQGKKTLVKEISNNLHYLLAEVDTNIDSIRNMIDTSYKQTEPIIYLISDADDMSLGARNSLLKVIEEPPQQAYFIMTLKQIENTLATIKSRAYIFYMQDYSLEEKQKMIDELLPNNTIEDRQILNKFENYYQIQQIVNYGPKEFADYVKKVFDNIYKVQSANSFKLAEKLDIKVDGNGYDLELFWLAYLNEGIASQFDCVSANDWDKADIIERCLQITARYINQLSIKGINRQMLIDNWILDIRKVWLQYDKNRN